MACSHLHNFLVDIMEMNVPWVGRGWPVDNNDKLWLERPAPNNPEYSRRSLEYKFSSIRSILANHLHVFWQCGVIIEEAGFL